MELASIKEKIAKINQLIAKESWLDMEVLGMQGGNLTIIGSTDFSEGHTLEISFVDAFYMSLNHEWGTDTSTDTLHIATGEEAKTININQRIEQGNTVFKIIAEDFDTPFYVAAKDIDFNTDHVLYYKKDNLADNERIADWVK